MRGLEKGRWVLRKTIVSWKGQVCRRIWEKKRCEEDLWNSWLKIEFWWARPDLSGSLEVYARGSLVANSLALRKVDIESIWMGESVIGTGRVRSVASFSFVFRAGRVLFFDRNAALCWEGYMMLCQLSMRMTVNRIHRWSVLMFSCLMMRGDKLFLQLTKSKVTCVSSFWVVWYSIVAFFVWNRAPGRWNGCPHSDAMMVWSARNRKFFSCLLLLMQLSHVCGMSMIRGSCADWDGTPLM